MSLLPDLILVALNTIKKTVPALAKLSAGKKAISASQLETAGGLFGGFFTEMQRAIQAKNFGADAEIALEDAVKIAAGLGFGEPVTGIISALLPYAFDELNKFAGMPLTAVDGGLGGFVTNDWANDPRHALRPDGSFKNG
jgi:hypothetical protein